MAGRKMIEIDEEVLMDLALKGLTQKEMAKELDVSAPTISKRIAQLQSEQGVLLQYRALQSLQLTKLQAKTLEAITDQKIAEAPLRDLVLCFKILKDKELILEGKPSEIRGLVGYLVELERKEIAAEEPPDESVEVEFEEVKEDIFESEGVPDL